MLGNGAHRRRAVAWPGFGFAARRRAPALWPVEEENIAHHQHSGVGNAKEEALVEPVVGGFASRLERCRGSQYCKSRPPSRPSTGHIQVVCGCVDAWMSGRTRCCWRGEGLEVATKRHSLHALFLAFSASKCCPTEGAGRVRTERDKLMLLYSHSTISRKAISAEGSSAFFFSFILSLVVSVPHVRSTSGAE